MYHHDTGLRDGSHASGRYATLLLYLSGGGGGDAAPGSGGDAPFEGGETSFPLAEPSPRAARAPPPRTADAVRARFGGCNASAGLSAAPRAGDALLFFNMWPANSRARDHYAWHGSCALRGAGEKWVANIFFHLPPSRESAGGPG